MNYLIRKLLFLCLVGFAICSCHHQKAESITKAVKMDPSKAILAYEIKAELGEGAFWNYKTQTFYWIDIEGKKLHIFDPVTQQNRTFETPTRIGTVVPANSSEAMVALEDGIHILNTDNGDLKIYAEIESEVIDNRMNDGKCDPSGRLWAGTMHMPQTAANGTLYKIDGEGRYEAMVDSVTISNGIVWTKDSKTMYYIDTPTGYVRAYDYNDISGQISNERKVIEVPESIGYPDGMAIDSEDKLWIGLWNGNKVARYDPVTGKMMSIIDVPAHNVSACAFGGPNLDTLYITTARVDMTDAELDSLPLSGSLFKAVPGVRGVKTAQFKKEQ